MKAIETVAKNKVIETIKGQNARMIQQLINELTLEAVKQVEENLTFKMVPSGDNNFKIEAVWKGEEI